MLQKQSILITGSTSGIGFATATALLQKGHRVYLNGRSTETVESALKSIKKQYPKADVDAVVCDFSKEIDLTKFPPHLDVLINNVGIYTSQSFYDTSDQDWLKQFEVNCLSGVRLSRHYLKPMLKANFGRILFISSECAYLAPEDLISYSATKAAIHALSRGLSQLTRGSGVTVNTIVPGSTLTEGAESFIAAKAKAQQEQAEKVARNFIQTERPNSLIERFARTEEVANVIAFYASSESSAVNGSVIFCEGGSTNATY
jgi:NAD(P)-dependent dehydrogenase (short-subunit alcohol dehydrogenase family)